MAVLPRRLESFGVVLNDEFEIRRIFRNGLTDMTTSTSNLETNAVSASVDANS